jgi:hypothetical protein
MGLTRALIASFILHAVLCILLLLGTDKIWQRSKPAFFPIEAHMIIKKKDNNKNLLPKKIKAPIPKTDDEQYKKPLENNVLEKLGNVVKAAKTTTNESVVKKDNHNYTNTLATLSHSFANELTHDEVVEPEGNIIDNSSYFDQIYSLIKEAFVVPPHLDGPKGQNLKAILRIFLASDGSLNKLVLETSSGDEHFDKAVIDGTKRVINFGAVPILLQNVLHERGIVVELCPVKCHDR